MPERGDLLILRGPDLQNEPASILPHMLMI
jgi:hypothetical protein